MSTDSRLKGRVAIITGSGRNIGRAIALAFAREGASIVVNGHSDQSALDTVVREAGELGANAIGVLADVSKPAGVKQLVLQCLERFGKVDIAVSNVAVRKKQSFLDISDDDWDSTLASNLGSAFHMAQAVIPGMLAARHGRLIHISGVDG